MKRGTLDISDIKRGDTDIEKVYRGSNLIWERGCSSPLISTTGLALYYKFNGNANHYNNSTYNLTPVNTPTYVSGKFDDATSLNGTNQRFQLSNSIYSISSLSAISISTWINLTDLPTSGTFRAIASKYSTSAGAGGFDLRYYNDSGVRKLQWFCINGSGSISNMSSYDINFNTSQWYHVAATYQGGQGKLYLDGVEVASATSTSFNFGNVTRNFNIGCIDYDNPPGPTRFWKGQIDDFSLWHRVLTPSEIEQLASNCPLT